MIKKIQHDPLVTPYQDYSNYTDQPKMVTRVICVSVYLFVSESVTVSLDLLIRFDSFWEGQYSCADPESFVRWGPTLTVFFVVVF